VTARKRRARRPAGSGHPLWLGAILVLTFVVYLPSLDNDFTNWDDNFYVTENPILQSGDLGRLVTTPLGGNHHPLTMLSLALNYRMSGLEAASYHWLSLLLHLANTALVFRFVWALSGGRPWTSVVTSLFFGIHPMHVESVAWISERKDVLYALFYLLGLLAYLRYLRRERIAWLGAALAAFVLSAASKPAAVVFPLALLAIDWFRGRPLRGRALVEKAPFFAVSAAVGLITLQAQRATGAITEAWGPFQKLLFAAYGIAVYFAKLFLPIRLSALYPYPPLAAGGIGPEYYAALAVVAVGLPALVLAFRRSRVVLFGLLFFFINIVLVLQFFAVGGAVLAERYTYLPYIGLFLALAWWLDEPPGARTFGARAKPVLAAILLLLLPLSLVQTWRRCDVWKNSETLWNDAIAKYPGRIADAYNDRGLYYHQQKRFAEALADFDRAVAINARTPKLWFNRAITQATMGQGDSAIASFDRGIALAPDDASAHNNRGAARFGAGDLAGAIEDYNRAIDLDPRLRDAYANRALARIRTANLDGAVADARRALELAPGHPAAYVQHGLIAVAFAQMGLPREAIPEFDAAIQGAPPGEDLLRGYYYYRGLAKRAVGDGAGALRDLQESQRRGGTVEPALLRELGG
jgi:tetratricopeptide (TPR) repeat protein